MKIDNFKVYDLEESIIASGLPMKNEYIAEDFEKRVRNGGFATDYQRACKLAANAPGTGHNNFLSGILVAANVTATNVWWLQMERYHFVQIVSMQSKMHRLREMLKECKFTYPKSVIGLEAFSDVMQSTGEQYSDEELVYRCPMGLELTARITTNYLQLKTIYGQRKAHKLQEWRDFCAWIETLPLAKELIIRTNKEQQNGN